MTGRAAAAAFLAAALAAQAPGLAAAPRGLRCFGRSPTIVGTAGDDRIVGTRGPDVIVALRGDDVVHGGDGRDRICGGDGTDEVDGRYGPDFVDGGPGDDRALGGPGDDVVIGGPGDDFASGGDGRAESDTVVGSGGRDQLLGGDGSVDEDYLFGGPGLDFMDGGLGGDDELYGGPGNDRMGDGRVSYELSSRPVSVDLRPDHVPPTATGEGFDYMGGVHEIVGSPYDDVIEGSPGRNVFHGGHGDDRISGGAGFDVIDGGEGDDTLDGGTDGGIVSFGDASAGVIASLLTGMSTGAGEDSLSGFAQLEGSYYDDSLTGDDEPNWIYGSFGTNEIFGLGGDDYLEFGDTGDAGTGVDECIWSALENCERDGHFDPPSLPYLTSPLHRRDVERLDSVKGGLAGGVGGPADTTVVVSIRRLTSGGCWWWRRSAQGFVRGGCGVPVGNELTPDDNGRWELRVGETLPPGVYRVSATWRSPEFAEGLCGGAFAPMCVSFDVR